MTPTSWGVGSENIPDGLEFDPSSGRLYGYWYAGTWPNGSEQLLSINPQTGAATPIATIASGAFSTPGWMNPLDAAGHRFFIYGEVGISCGGTCYNPGPWHLYVVNTQTGAVSITAYSWADYPGGLQFDPSSGTLYVFTYVGTWPNGSEQLLSINPQTGAPSPVATIASGAFSVPGWVSALDTAGHRFFLYGEAGVPCGGNCFNWGPWQLYVVNTQTGAVSITANSWADYLQGLEFSNITCPELANGSQVTLFPDGPDIKAVFTPTSGSLAAAAAVCGFTEFDWQQSITAWPVPINPTNANNTPLPGNVCQTAAGNFLCIYSTLTPNSPVTAPPPVMDPVPGGYTYNPARTLNNYPFYYDTTAVPTGCAIRDTDTGACVQPITAGNTVTFFDSPCLPALNPINQSACKTNPGWGLPCFRASAPLAEFTTSLVGVLPGNPPSGPIAVPIMSWSWVSDYNYSSGGVGVGARTFNDVPAPPGGAGGVTITGINGVQLPPVVPSSQVATTASGLAYSRVTQTFNGTVTVRNISGSAISGPLQILFTAMTSGVTLTNATSNLSGTPYLTVPAPASLAPGQSVTVSVQFKNPSNATINFTPVIYSGSIN
jgi:hypothetical protein